MLSVYCKRGTKVVSVQNWSFLVANFETLQKDSRTWNMFSSFFQCMCDWVCVFLRAPYPFTIVTVNWWWCFFLGEMTFWQVMIARLSCASSFMNDIFSVLFFLQLDRWIVRFPFPKCVMICYEFRTSFVSSNIYSDDFTMVMNFTLHSSWQHWFWFVSLSERAFLLSSKETLSRAWTLSLRSLLSPSPIHCASLACFDERAREGCNLTQILLVRANLLYIIIHVNMICEWFSLQFDRFLFYFVQFLVLCVRGNLNDVVALISSI